MNLRRLLRPAVSLGAGLTATLAFAPFNMPLFALLSPALFYLCIAGISAKRAIWIGWCYGVGFFGAGVSWVYVSIHTYGYAPIPLAVLLTSLFVMVLATLFALQGWCFARFYRIPRHAWLGFIGIWIVFEWLRSWLFTGFPWLYLGYAWIDTPLSSLAAILGVWGLSLLSLLFAVGITEAIRSQRPGPGLIALALPLVTLLLPNEWTTPDAKPPLRVALVQPNISQHDKWDSGNLPHILNQQIELSMPHKDVDLIIWPETAIPSLYFQAAPYVQPFFDYLDSYDTTLMSGFPFMTGNPHDESLMMFHNSLGIFSGSSGVYHKQRLVPFGEYVPFENQLRGLITFFDLPMSEFSLPQETQLTLPVKDWAIAPLICYEIAYPELTRMSALDSHLLLTVSNDAWFGDSLAAYQHLQIARMRAIENGRWLLRGTNDGITAIIRSDGSIEAQIPRNVAKVLTAEVPAMQGKTPYQHLGVWPTLLIALLLMTLGWRPWQRISDKYHRTAG